MYNDSLKRIAASWAQDEAARRLAEEQARAQAQQNQPTGLGAVLAGIGRSIGNVGESLYNIGGTGIASIRDIFTGNAGTGKYQNEWKEYRKEQMGDKEMSDKDYYLKQGGQALDAAATVSDFIPGLGKGAKVALNVAQGGASGIGQTLQDKGASATAEDLLKSGAVGLASAGAGQAVGAHLANKALTSPARGILGKAVQSGIGRGAITGAVSGATGGGLGTALEGGDLGQTLSGALQGAGGGALGGAATSAIYGLAGAGLDKVKNKIENGPKSLTAQMAQETPINVLADQEKPMTEGQRRRTTPTGWNDEDLTGQAKKQNYLQKLGGDLQDAAQATRDSAIYGKLKGNTGDEMIAKDAINNLRKNYGYSPDDYEQASKLSTAINKWYDNEIQSSGAEKINTKLSSDLSLPTNNTLPEKYEKAYTETIRNALNMANAGDSDVIDKYTAAGLERAAKYLGEQEQKQRRTSMNGIGGRPDGDRAELADYYKNARQTLRNEVNSMIELDDITKGNLSKMLDNAGATKQAKEAILKAKTFSDVKTATSPLEDARTMYRQMKSSGLKRSAAGDNSMNLTTQVANKTGLNNLLDVAGKPIRTGAAAAENTVGKAISAVGDSLAGENTSQPGRLIGAAAKTVKAANAGLNAGDSNYGFSADSFPGKLGAKQTPLTVGDIATNQISRQAGLGAMRSQDAQRQAQNAQNALSEAQTAYNTAANNYAAAQQAAATTPAQTAGVQQLERIKTAMDLALAAGDITSYSKLADLYTTAYKIYGADTSTASKLTSKQQSALDEANNSLSMVDQLEAAFNRAGGGQGAIMGNVSEFTNWLTGGGANAGLSSYNALKQSLGTSIVKNVVNLGGTEADAQRYLAMLPSATDTPELAAQKLNELRTMLNNMKANIGSTS